MAPTVDTPSVCAVVDVSLKSVARAVEEQTRRPNATVPLRDSLPATLRRAVEGGAEWVWILDGTAVPRPGALAALLDALARVDDLARPDLLAGVVRTPDGRFDEGRGLWCPRREIALVMAAAPRRLLPIYAAAGPVLVRGDALRGVRLRRTELSPGGMLDLTARILGKRTGYLVPESRSDAAAPFRADRAATAARLVLGGAFKGLDRLRIGYEVLHGAGQDLNRAESAPRPAPR